MRIDSYIKRPATPILTLFFAFCLLPVVLFGQELSTHQVLKNCINYHDPKGQLLSKALSFMIKETRPNDSDRNTRIAINIPKEEFSLIQIRDSYEIESILKKGESYFLINGSETFSEELKEKFRLNEKRLLMLKNYYQYLWLLPNKLLDDGARLSEKINRKEFFGRDALEMKVTYDPDVGKDIWYFYFHPENYALIGYRFYHDEIQNDGEYIILDGEVKSGKIRIPKERKWYMHQNDKYLGSDILEKLTTR